MTVQTLTLGKQKFVVVPEKEFRRLQQKALQTGSEGKASAPRESTGAEDRRDASVLRRRLAEMRRRGEKPLPYARARKELGLP
jgi:hypothetical protein